MNSYSKSKMKYLVILPFGGVTFTVMEFVFLLEPVAWRGNMSRAI